MVDDIEPEGCKAMSVEDSCDGGRITVVPWVDPVVEARGFDPHSPYLELVWLPVIGPSTAWLLRRLVAGLRVHPEGYPVDLAELAAALGLSASTARRSPVQRSLQRLIQFHLAREVRPGVVGVRRKVGPVTAGQLARLPVALQQAHRRLTASAAMAEAS